MFSASSEMPLMFAFCSNAAGAAAPAFGSVRSVRPALQ
jgi:hypothetical protein